MVRRPKADWVLGVFGVLGFREFGFFGVSNNYYSCYMLQIKIHEPKIFEARKIKFK
jgi:hypothetical protein